MVSFRLFMLEVWLQSDGPHLHFRKCSSLACSGGAEITVTASRYYGAMMELIDLRQRALLAAAVPLPSPSKMAQVALTPNARPKTTFSIASGH